MSKSTKESKIETEVAAYLVGRNWGERRKLIADIVRYIQEKIDHYRAPGHKPVSLPKLIHSTAIQRARSEVEFRLRPGRDIVYFDTADLALRRAEIQLRMETRQKPGRSKGTRQYVEVTMKVGDKARTRLEMPLEINPRIWKKQGFYAALQAGMRADIKSKQSKKGKKAAQARAKEFRDFNAALKKSLGKVTKKKLKDLKPLPLVHLKRDTTEAKYSPFSHDKVEVEIKADDCEVATFLKIRRHRKGFAQVEFERISGSAQHCRSELAILVDAFRGRVVPTNDSKEDPGMSELERILLPQNSTEAERLRVKHNRAALEKNLRCLKFQMVLPREIGLRMRPVRGRAPITA